MIFHGIVRAVLPAIMMSLLLIACKRDAKLEEADTAVVTDENQSENVEADLISVLQNPYSEIDGHARRSADIDERDISSLAKYLGSTTSSDLEKARTIYTWLTANVTYDDDAFNTGSFGDYSASAVLISRKAVCEGFSNLFQALGREMGLNIRKVSGYAKGYGYTPGQNFRQSNHAWNVINIDGRWRIFDATWGEGNGKTISNKLVSEKKFDPYWFDLDPYRAIFDHFPEDDKYTFVTPNISLDKYERLPGIDKSYFQYGFDGRKTYEMSLFDEELTFPKCFRVETDVLAIEAPELQDLRPDRSYNFVFKVPAGKKMALIDSKNEWTFFEKEGNLFSLNYLPEEAGDLKVSVQHGESGNSFGTLLLYRVGSQTH